MTQILRKTFLNSILGSFQLIIMTFEEYILLIIENQMITELDAELKDSLAAHLRNTGNILDQLNETELRCHRQVVARLALKPFPIHT